MRSKFLLPICVAAFIGIAMPFLIPSAFSASEDPEPPETPAPEAPAPEVPEAPAPATTEPDFLAGIQVYGPLIVRQVREGTSPNFVYKQVISCVTNVSAWTYITPNEVDLFRQFPRAALSTTATHFANCSEPGLSTSQSYAAMILVQHRGPTYHGHNEGHIYFFTQGTSKFDEFRKQLGAHFK